MMGVAPFARLVLDGRVPNCLGGRPALLKDLLFGTGLLGLVMRSIDESRDAEVRRLDLLGIGLFGSDALQLCCAIACSRAFQGDIGLSMDRC